MIHMSNNIHEMVSFLYLVALKVSKKEKQRREIKLVFASYLFPGNFALFNWKNNQLLTERNVQDNIHDVSILHNQQLFALAQSHYVYIYDSKGTCHI